MMKWQAKMSKSGPIGAEVLRLTYFNVSIKLLWKTQWENSQSICSDHQFLFRSLFSFQNTPQWELCFRTNLMAMCCGSDTFRLVHLMSLAQLLSEKERLTFWLCDATHFPFKSPCALQFMETVIRRGSTSLTCQFVPIKSSLILCLLPPSFISCLLSLFFTYFPPTYMASNYLYYFEREIKFLKKAF